MSDDTFTCDRCGLEFPRRQMKEAYHEEGGERVKRNLCPNCLDAVMNEAGTVQGTEGEEKQAAVELDQGAAPPESERFGERS